jgi:hypothetical protein
MTGVLLSKCAFEKKKVDGADMAPDLNNINLIKLYYQLLHLDILV